MNPRLQRALLLLQGGRHVQAADELRHLLNTQPNDVAAHATLAMCLAYCEQYAEATEEARTAIQLAPDNPFGFYAQAIVLRCRNRYSESEQSIRQAIDLDPDDADYFALLGQLHLEQSRWQQALDAAVEGLGVEPENVDCMNVQARALVQTNRGEHARVAIEGALAREPENAETHANFGWTLLDEGKYYQAMEHFREALRLQPDLEWARLGVIEALKAKRILYRPVLWYFLWISKFTTRAQWGIILGAFIGVQVLRRLALANPALMPWVVPLILVYAVWAFSSWMAIPLFNLALLLDPFGRLALSKDEKITGTWVGLCLLGAILGLAGAVAGVGTACLPIALVCALLIPPISRIQGTEPGWPRLSMVAITAGLALLGMAAVTCIAMGIEDGTVTQRRFSALGGLLIVCFVVAALASQLVANAQASIRPSR